MVSKEGKKVGVLLILALFSAFIFGRHISAPRSLVLVALAFSGARNSASYLSSREGGIVTCCAILDRRVWMTWSIARLSWRKFGIRWCRGHTPTEATMGTVALTAATTMQDQMNFKTLGDLAAQIYVLRP
jgi:hypothetical protein